MFSNFKALYPAASMDIRQLVIIKTWKKKNVEGSFCQFNHILHQVWCRPLSVVNNLPNFSENNRTVNQCSSLCTAAPPLRKIEERDFATQTSLFSILSEGRGRLYTGHQCSRILLWNRRRRFRGSQLGRKVRRDKSFQAWAPGNIVLPDQFQTVAAVLASDWCQKVFVFFCPITEQQTLGALLPMLQTDCPPVS